MDLPKGDFLQFLRSKTIHKLESFFYRYGCLVASRPWTFIIFTLVMSGLCCLGLFRFRQEKHPLKLWVPPQSNFAQDTEWLMREFEEALRVQSVLITAPDVLTPRVFIKLADIRNRIVASRQGNIGWEDVCFRIPMVPTVISKQMREGVYLNNENALGKDDKMGLSYFSRDPSVTVPQDMYCNFFDSFRRTCLEHSLLELWNFHDQDIKNLTKEKIIDKLNSTRISPHFGIPMEFEKLLGDVERNSSGAIVRAGSIISFWMVHVNFSIVDMDKVGNDGGTADWATGDGMLWESSFLNTMKNITASSTNETFKIHYAAGRSFGDVSNAAMFKDMDKVMIGVCMMFLFVQFVLSRCNMLELKFIPGIAGLSCVGLAFISAVGICSYLGIYYGPVHTSLPFLLMGIGVDDMFVIVACRNQLTLEEKKASIPIQLGLALKQAGVSITITSMTDVVASVIGGTTILPALESFCLYAAVGVMMTFIYQATFFVAFLAVDENRIQKARNSVVCCYTHKDYEPPKCSRNNYSKDLLHWLYSKILLTKLGKILIILVTIGFACFGTYGCLNLRQKFDKKWVLSENSYFLNFLNEREKYYPLMGQDAGVYFGKLNYSEELYNIHSLTLKLKNETDILEDVDSWLDKFRKYVNHNFDEDIPNNALSDEAFRYYLGRFLHSPSGAKYQKNFRFLGKLSCAEPTPPIQVSSINFNFKLFYDDSQLSVRAMNRVKSVVKSVNFTTGDKFVTVWARVFANWVTDEVIHQELFRNLALALICVMATTTMLILDVNVCFWLLMCVLLTLVNTCGFMHYWGLTVDVVSCIALVLAIGLCVDYAAHVGHTFLYLTGSKQERALNSVLSVGAAVINGGLSTLVSMSMLSFCDTYIFHTFFKIFLLVVLFGLFHGVIFLPVILSYIGSDSHVTKQKADIQLEVTENLTKKKEIS